MKGLELEQTATILPKVSSHTSIYLSDEETKAKLKVAAKAMHKPEGKVALSTIVNNL